MAFLFCLSFFSCASLPSPQISYVPDTDNPLRDDSFLCEKEAPTFKVEFVEEKRETVLDYLIEKNIVAVQNPFKKSQLICYGELSEVLNSKTDEKLKPVVQRINFRTMKKRYAWIGQTEYENKKYDTKFYVTVKGSGEKRKFRVQNIDSGSVSMRLHKDFGFVQVDTPCLFATVTDAAGKYSVYATQNNRYRAFGKDSSSEYLVKKYMPKISTRELYNLKGQKYQFVAESGGVLAESSGGEYKIFLLQEDERYLSLVQSVALVETYRSVMNRIDSLKPTGTFKNPKIGALEFKTSK